MDLLKIITFLNVISLLSNLINISYTNLVYRITNILIIIFLDRNINNFARNLISIFYGMLNNLPYVFNDVYCVLSYIIIVNIQFIFWIGFFSLIYYFAISSDNTINQ